MFLLLLIVPLLSMFPWKSRAQKSYFPNTKGSWWTSNQYNFHDGELTVGNRGVCMGDTFANGKSYFEINQSDTSIVKLGTLYRWENNKLFAYGRSTQREYLWADFGLQRGDTFSVIADTIQFLAKVLSTDTNFRYHSKSRVCRGFRIGVDIHVSFKHTYCIQYTESRTHKKSTLYFKKGVGLVGVKFTEEIMWVTKWKVKRK